MIRGGLAEEGQEAAPTIQASGRVLWGANPITSAASSSTTGQPFFFAARICLTLPIQNNSTDTVLSREIITTDASERDLC
jgi:hypothetical protein